MVLHKIYKGGQQFTLHCTVSAGWLAGLIKAIDFTAHMGQWVQNRTTSSSSHLIYIYKLEYLAVGGDIIHFFRKMVLFAHLSSYSSLYYKHNSKKKEKKTLSCAMKRFSRSKGLQPDTVPIERNMRAYSKVSFISNHAVFAISFLLFSFVYMYYN